MTGEQPDDQEIERWRKAAAKEDVNAMTNLGLVAAGLGRVDGEDSAESWWIAAAAKGGADAMFNLGVLRFEVERTIGHDSAAYWWDNAAARRPRRCDG